MSNDIRVLQAARLKGRPSGEQIAAAAGVAAADVPALVTPLVESGALAEVKGRFKLTGDGKARLESLLEAERGGVDEAGLATAYREFDAFNAEFKQLVTDWQLIDGTTPNDHTDPEYDDKIVRRLADLHERFLPLLQQLVTLVPRLGPYPDRFSSAIDKVLDGDHSWLARPLVDSYHTVWFELHEDLIGLCGLSRTAEAAAGRAE